MRSTDGFRCGQVQRVSLYVLRALPPGETAEMVVHLSMCQQCQREMEALGPVVNGFASWPTDILRPPEGLWERLADRIAEEGGGTPMLVRKEQYLEPAWEDVGPGISCKLLATDAERDRVSMLVRLEPGAGYPPHTHAGVEELHLLDGELWIDDRKLFPGDYSRAETGTSDRRVWSETGCTCVLITSTRDILG